MTDSTFIDDFAEALLVVAGNALVAAGSAPIGHAQVVAGDPVLDDGYCCPGLLAVGFGAFGATESFPIPMATSALNCTPPTLMIDYTVTLARCWPTPNDNGQPPDDLDMGDAAAGIGLDSYAIWRGVLCWLLAEQADPNGVSAIITRAEVMTPEGACVTFVMNITVGFDDACVCETPSEFLVGGELLVALFGTQNQ